MDFIDRIEELANRIPKQIEYCTTEEATKNALVLPFIQALGYDVFNPAEVMPELTADFGTKKGEKVDYAIMQDGKALIVFECKRAGTALGENHTSQLYRYFSTLSDVRFGVLTDGVVYQFYSDLDAPNRMDAKPFFAFDMLDYQERHVEELKKFTKSTFDLDTILETASELKYTAAIKRIIAREFDQPSDEFVTFLAKQVYSGRMTQSAREQFSDITRKALRRFLNDQISERLQSALEATGRAEPTVPAPEPYVEEPDDVEGVVREDRKKGIVTTEEEIEAYFAVKSILRDVIDIKRVHMRDAKSYCNVLLDDNNRKPVCRMHFNRAQKYLGLFDQEKREERVPIDDLDEIYNYGDRIVATVKWYDSKWGAPPPAESRPSTSRSQVTEAYTGKKIQAFAFQGVRHEVNSWRAALFGVIELMRSHDQASFERSAPKMVGRKRPYIAPDSSELRAPQLIPQTQLYVETNLSSQMIAGLCNSLVQEMGFESEDLTFEVY